jgi:hypothetical protein
MGKNMPYLAFEACIWSSLNQYTREETGLFTIAKLESGKVPNNWWLDKEHTVYVYTMKYYSWKKKKEILSFAGKWMELKIIMLSEI